MRRFLILATAVLAGGLLPACGDDDPMEPETIFGLYILQTVDGEELPVNFYPQSILVVIAGSMQLDSNGSYSFSLTTALFGGAPETDTGTGTFTVGRRLILDGSTVQFDPDPFEPATVSGNTLTLVADGIELGRPVRVFLSGTFVFRK